MLETAATFNDYIGATHDRSCDGDGLMPLSPLEAELLPLEVLFPVPDPELVPLGGVPFPELGGEP
jgi:hypothetical protein